MINNYNGKHWTANKYRRNGKWVAMPKDIIHNGKPALQFGKEIVELPGIISIHISCDAEKKYYVMDRHGNIDREQTYTPTELHPIGHNYTYESPAYDKQWVEVIEEQINKPEPVTIPEPVKPEPAFVAPVKSCVPINPEPMTVKQRRYLYILTRRNYERNAFTKSQASALITELTGKE